MSVRSATALAILLAFAALAILAFLGNLGLGAIFELVAGAALVRHATGLCPRCSTSPARPPW